MPTSTSVETSPDTTLLQAKQGASPQQVKQPASSDPGGVTADGSKPVIIEPPVPC